MQVVAKLANRYRVIEQRYGRRRALQALLLPAVLLVLMGRVAAERLRFDPYREARELVEAQAFPTAVARLDELSKRGSYQKQAEYWFWRGRALMGDRQYEAGAEAYRSAIQRDALYREDGVLIADLVTAVAKAGNTKAKNLLLTESGPRALSTLVNRTLAREKIDRWTLAEIAERLGGHDRLDYDTIALTDLDYAATCAEKKRAVQKVGEHHVTDARGPLQELDAQPQWKCLQPTLKNVLAELASR
jgi:tetratricopeptide (TPR) repeat protein